MKLIEKKYTSSPVAAPERQSLDRKSSALIIGTLHFIYLCFLVPKHFPPSRRDVKGKPFTCAFTNSSFKVFQ